MRVSHLPLRAASGAFILNAGLAKKSLDPSATAGLQKMACNAIPQLQSMPPETFNKAIIGGEIALGTALLAPLVPPMVAGAALTAFSAALLRVYWAPGTREPGSPRPERQGTAIAKDAWLLGTGLALVIDSVTDGTRRTARRTKKAAKRTGDAVRRTAEDVREALPV